MVEIKEFGIRCRHLEVDKIKELGDKICRLVDYHAEEKGRILEIATLVDVLFGISRILRSHDERFKELLSLSDKGAYPISTGDTEFLKVIIAAILKGKIIVDNVKLFDGEYGWKKMTFHYK